MRSRRLRRAIVQLANVRRQRCRQGMVGRLSEPSLLPAMGMQNAATTQAQADFMRCCAWLTRMKHNKVQVRWPMLQLALFPGCRRDPIVQNATAFINNLTHRRCRTRHAHIISPKHATGLQVPHPQHTWTRTSACQLPHSLPEMNVFYDVIPGETSRCVMGV
jgi:hypothetical protein